METLNVRGCRDIQTCKTKSLVKSVTTVLQLVHNGTDLHIVK